MKTVLIINGSGGVGKDTFVNCLNKIKPTKHISIAALPKAVANMIGWKGSKTEKDRKFLSDIKLLIDDYNDENYQYIKKEIEKFYSDDQYEILCIDVREQKDIERIKKDFDAITVLVTRGSVPQITSNIADANVYSIKYDYLITNDGTIDDLQVMAEKFIKKHEKTFI